uniref:Bulb-type lectin domain-containing protein n=1 Tax=Gadus morhua TaxID=8049 RepID=A0A8C5BLB6_GADMO
VYCTVFSCKTGLEDGNFVIYKWSQTWVTNTECSQTNRVTLQEDTNLVMNTATGEAPWCSGSYTRCPSQQVRLTLTNDGHLVLDNKGNEVWRP